MNRTDGRSALLSSITQRPSQAFVALLADCCRHSAAAREWLCEDFGRNARTRANFTAMLEDGAPSSKTEVADGFTELAGEAHSWRQEARQLRVTASQRVPRLYGGLTWGEMEKLVRRYEAGALEVGVFLLARDWRKAGAAAASSSRLLRAAGQFLNAVILARETRLLIQLKKALSLLNQAKAGARRAAVGYADWWKLQTLLYMLRHPREAYRTRDVRAHLVALGLEISSLDFRRFCKRHGIRRDERPGRPRSRPEHDKPRHRN